MERMILDNKIQIGWIISRKSFKIEQKENLEQSNNDVMKCKWFDLG